MGKGRLEAFSDGVIAIIITIMVLEMKVPHGEDLAVLVPLVPVFLTYALSFLYVGIYWNNHHHLLHTVQSVSAGVLWANLHLLFWLSLFPFATGFMGENHFARVPSVLYGVVLLGAAMAYTILQSAIIRAQGRDSVLAIAIGSDWKGKVSLLGYVLGIASTFVVAWAAEALYVAVALLWLVPDPRIARTLARRKA